MALLHSSCQGLQKVAAEVVHSCSKPSLPGRVSLPLWPLMQSCRRRHFFKMVAIVAVFADVTSSSRCLATVAAFIAVTSSFQNGHHVSQVVEGTSTTCVFFPGSAETLVVEECPQLLAKTALTCSKDLPESIETTSPRI